MTLYAIIGRDRPDSLAARQRARPAHLKRMQDMVEQGRIVLAGPFPAVDCPDPGPAGYSGSLIVAEFGSLEEAQHWAAEDPYMTDGVFAAVDVRPFRQVLP